MADAEWMYKMSALSEKDSILSLLQRFFFTPPNIELARTEISTYIFRLPLPHVDEHVVDGFTLSLFLAWGFYFI